MLLTETWYPAAASSPADAQHAPAMETSLSPAVASATPRQIGASAISSLVGKTTCSRVYMVWGACGVGWREVGLGWVSFLFWGGGLFASVEGRETWRVV